MFNNIFLFINQVIWNSMKGLVEVQRNSGPESMCAVFLIKFSTIHIICIQTDRPNKHDKKG